MSKKYIATCNGQETPFQVEEKGPDQLNIISGSKEWTLDVHRAGENHYSVIHEGESFDLRFFYEDDTISAFLHGEHLTFQLGDARSASKKRTEVVGSSKSSPAVLSGPVEIKATMPGKIVKVSVKKGDKVSEGQGVLVVEAMKMENEMASPKTGVVSDIRISEGQSVESGAVMMVIE